MNIRKYNSFIVEGRGISNLIKDYSDIIFDEFKISNLKFQTDFDYEELPLIDLRIEFIFGDNYSGEFDPRYSKFKDNKLYDIFIKIEIDRNNIIDHKILGVISHELTHINEYFNIQKNIINKGIEIKPTYIDIRSSYKKLNIKKDECYYEFIYLLYLSLDTEMNARISQVYHYLYEFNNINEDFLFSKLILHKNWEYVEMLENFNSNLFIDKCINEIEINGLIKITNDIILSFKDKDLNKKTKLLKFIKEDVKDYKDLKSFYESWSLYFKVKSKYHIDKFKYIISEVSEDLKGNRPFNEDYRNKRYN